MLFSHPVSYAETYVNYDYSLKKILKLQQNKAKVKSKWSPPRTRFRIAFKFQMKTNAILVFLSLLLFLVRHTHGQGPGPQASGLTMRSREADMRVQFEIEEGQPPGTVVGTIPTKANFTYRFNERPPEFLLNGTTGVITTAMEIDREMLASERFDLIILSSQPTYPLEVRIVILDINDNSPFFPEPSIEVSFSESANIGTRVILDTATDRDVGINDVNTDYKIVFGNDEGKFRLVVTTNPSGETPYLHLETTGRLDREIRSFYQLNISAQDGGTPPRFGYLLVNITVLDVNDNPPIFDHSDYSVSLNESVPPGTSVLQVRGTDNDIGDNARIIYFLSDTESQFTVDPITGVISTLEILKCQQNCPTQGKCSKSCVFTVYARDHGTPRQDGRAYVTVNLLDANDHDPSIRFRFFPSTASYATVDENAQNGSVVAAVSVIDLDEGPNGETWVEIQGGNELGHFRLESTPSFDIVRVNGVLDREQIGKYNLTITATDRGIPPRSSTAFLIIHVNDVNDHEPIFEKNEYSAVLAETVLIGTYVAGISATDEDTGVNSDIYYAIVSGNDRRWFDIDVHTGLITTSSALNREDQDYVELKISARDGGPNPRWTYTYLRIQILDQNDEAPSFAEDIMNVTLIESSPPNSLVAVVTAVDNDLGTNGSVEYFFHPDVERLYPNKFMLDSTYGRLTLREQVDREEIEVYNIPLIAKDQGTPSLSSTATVRITIIDVNDNKPYFYPKQYFYTLHSSDLAGTVVAKLTATDADVGKNAELAFSLVSGGEGNFEVDKDTGIVKTKTHFSKKREISKYEIIVAVYNPNDRTMSDEAVVLVYIGDAQHRTMQFDQNKGYNFVIEEDVSNSESGIGKEVGRVSVKSRSMRSGVKYSITNGDPDEWFQIEDSLGIISTTCSIDREIHARFTLQIVAYDFLGFTQTTVNVTITDINDFPPTFEHPTGPIEVMEDWPVGHEVYLVKAYDMDIGPNGRIEYSLSAQPHNTFYIDKTSGMICLNRPVRFEVGSEYEVVVTARDLGIPSLYSKLELTILIQDVNDRTPVFDHVAYETSLLESVPVNDRFFLLRATDADYGINKQLTYAITAGNDENRFGIFPDGYLYVKRPLDREKRDFYSLTVTAQDNGKEPRSSSVNIVIHIIDENDNSPTFDNKTFQFYIAENEPPDTYVGRLSAEDLDKGRNAELTYTITNTQTDFMINPKTGFIRTLRYFDREQIVEASGHDYLVMDAVVMDGSARLKDEAKITVHITDVNDNAPQFVRASYHAAISEGSPSGTQVIRIAAVDADDGINGNIQYSIVHGNDGNVFQIDDISGQITVSKPLDRETIAHYILTVMARDLGEDVSHNTTALVSIDVLDENDNVPRFDNATTKLINISEDAIVGSRIFVFSATDSDLGINAEITFLVASGNFKETFRIDGPSGSLYLARPLDYEDKNNYVLNVSASDGGTPKLTTTIKVIVKVLDVNDNAPRFSSTAVVRQIEESIPPNTPVVTLTAQDRDSGVNGKILFNISHQDPPGRHFAMQPETGVLYTTKVIDREYSDTFRLTVVATDQAEDPSMRLSVEKTVTIIVEDINDNAPTFVSMDAGVLPAGMEKGYKIMTLSASDPDANNNGMVTYELEGGDSALFTLDRLSGDLFTSRAIERLAVSYTLTVKATDQAVISARKSSRSKVTIIGTLRNSDGPMFESSKYTGSVLENKPIGTSVLSVRAQYPHGETERQVEYFLTAVTNAAGESQTRVFAINRFSGVISTASVLDREGGARMFHLDVYAVDTIAQSPKTSKAKITITVLDSNDSPPVFDKSPYKVSLSENAIAGHTVITVSASDPDTEGSLTYTLVNEKQDEKFRLDPLTGALYLSQPLDRETQDVHKIRIRADDGVQFSETTVVIEVIDSNDNSPVFDHPVYSFDIPEGTQRGAQAGLVSATDADIGVNKEISYSVLSDWGNNIFSLNPQTGIFTLTSHLDYEQMQHYIFVVQAQDSGTPSLSSTVTVYFNVVDLNDNAPLFDPMSYSDEVFENITVGTSILRVSATDMDSGDNGCIIYNIIDGNTDNKFAIDTDGTIFTIKTLDRETQSFYSLTVSATDRALETDKRLSSTVQVSVILKDVNDMAPEFVTPNEISVMENAPSNTVVMAIKAIDKDEGRNSYIEYSLASQSNSKFSLGPIDGLLRVVGPLDREQISEYKVTVVAKDRGHPSQSTMTDITIQVTDENDNSPSFLHQQYSATVSENTSVGLSVLQVFASDVDEGLNGQVRYSIIAGDLNHDFVIDQDTGIIRVSKNLDYEKKSHYSLTIQAEDSGVDIRHDTASVAIAITDVNDNPPIFHDSPYYVHVMENTLSLPVSLMLIMALDSDQIPNNQLQYLIKDGNRSIFSINANTGELSVQKTLDREQQSEYILTISCIDSGSPRQTGTGTVKVIVDDINDNQPQFAFKEYSTYIMENLPPLSPIITISASDEDIGRNAQIQYSLLGNHENKFKVDPDSGTISTNAILDREEHEMYNVLLVAQDLGLITQHKAVTNVTIIVEDENDNRPVFAESSYTVYTPDTAVGGHFVFGAVAVDLDAGLNSRLVYHLSGTDADKFQINQETGVVKLVQKLVNKSDGYQLKIHATDSGQTPLSSTTLVNVFTEKFQLFPRFHPGIRNFKFAESSENLLVTRISAVSPKINEAGKLKYYIAGGNSGNAFSVNSELGEVRLIGGLDRETISAYELWVEARDSDTPSLASAVKLEIQVTDINDNSPVFEKPVYNATVKEELEPPLFVIQVQASDADFGVNGDVEYHFDTENEANNPFSLDLKTGKIFTTEVLDRETQDEYRIFIKAIDHGTPQRTSSATVYIKVLDKNDNPPRFTRLFSANVTENAPIGTFIIQVTSSDKDINMNANATYSFTENPGGKFNIDPVSGNVTVAGWIDREVKDEYLLKVAAVDGSWQAETPLTVLIQDVNDNVPEFSLPEYTFNIPELMQGVLFIGQVTATDRDKKGPDSFVSYSLKRPSDLFRIDPSSGNILSKQVLYYKRTLKGSSPENRHVIQVVATDHGNPPLSSEVTVMINVIDSNNNAPVFQKEFYFSPIPESAAIGLSIFQVVSEDKEDVGINAEIEYFKTGGNGSEYFSVHRTTGWVTVSSPLVGLKKKWFSINIKATDKGVPPRSADVIGMFSVTDENHFAPAFTALSYQVVIPENEPLLSEIVTVTATDEDKGFNGEIIYSILSGNHDNQFQISPHSGSITIAKYLDFESVSAYHLNILASDRGFQSKNSTAVLTVLVTDVNDNPPIFNSTKFDVYLNENEPPGTYVTQLVAFDADSARNSIIEYSVVEGDDHTFFIVNPKNGVVTSKFSFDYEQKTKYTIQVIASNVGTLLFTSTVVDIHIAGKNEYYPHFIQPVFQFTVSESAGVGTTVGQLQAVDEDSGVDGEVYFLLVGSSNNKGFQIDSKSGSIKVSRALDRESQSRVVLTVLAKNAGSIRGNDTDEAQIVISIQDGNDPPVFSKDVYEARVSEAAPLGTSVVSVSAVDKDVHPNNNQFSFSILSGNVDKAFSIDPQSGAIYTAGNLDRETHSVYNLTVTATDSGNPPQSGSTLVKIYIDDVNDNGPTFDSSKVIGYVLENEPPFTNVMVLSVTDQDLPPNGAPFKFFLIGGDHKDYFEIESHTGLVKTTRSLDRELTPELEILVAVQDSGTPPLSSQNMVKIMVLDKNDSPSTSRPLTVLVWVHNKNFPGRKIADVHPQDLDKVGQYQCQIVEGNTGIFRIPRKCDLHASKFQNPGTYTLTVSGNDGKHRNVSSTVRVKFLNFDNATLENSVSLRIWNSSADAFLAMYYNNFLQALDNIFKSSSHPVVYSIVNVKEHLEITLAFKSSENTYVPSEDVLSLLNEKAAVIREILEEKDIDIGYNPCKISPCQNEGICRGFLEMKDYLSIVDSSSLVFTSPYVAREFSCQCPPGFSGTTCQNQQDPCLPNPCFSGSSCHQDGTSFRCVCAPQYQGERCDIPRKESCTTSLCKNGGTCQEAPNSGFFCLCRPGFKGLVCEQTADACRPNRCLNGGTCVSENLGYHCVCTSSYFGRHCEKSSYGFHPYSFMAFNPLQPTTNDISIVFSTNKQNALLVYNFGAQSGGRSDFLALEIINSVPTMSFGGSRTAITRISTNIIVSDGKWHKVTAIRNGKMSSVSVVHCNENGDTCEECLLGNSTCSKSASGHTGTLNFNGNLMFVGGIATVDPILERPGQVSTSDFVGCMRGLSVNGREIDMSAPIKSAFVTSTCGRKENSCSTSNCGESGMCINNWFTTSCLCDSELVAMSCTEAKKPFSIGGGNFLELIPQEKHRRTVLFIDKVKETSSKTISFYLRSYSQNGIVMFSGTDDEHTLLQLIKGKLIYSSKMKSVEEIIEELDLPLINDGQWHKISLSIHQGKNHQLNISADSGLHVINSKQMLHDFLDPYIPSITIGGQWEQLTGDGQFNDVSGCVKLIVVNNEVQQQNSTGYFKLYHHGNSNSMCQSEALGIDNVTTDPLSIGVILVIVFFVILLVVILISFLVFRKRKLKRDKGPSQIKQNGNNAFLTSASGESHRTHHCTETSNTDDVIRNHMPEDLVPKKMKDREHTDCPARPDIIEREIHNKPSPGALRIEEPPPHNQDKTQNNFVMQNPADLEAPEHYDLDNSSSIAPSDIDIVYHYKGFRDGNIHKYKSNPQVPSYHKHNHRHSPHQFQSNPVRESPRNILHQPHNPHTERDSPSSIKMQNTPLARLSPSSELSQQTPRILTLQDISGKPLQKALLATAQGVGSKQFQDPMTNSDRSLNSPVSNLSHSTSSMQSGHQNISKLKARDNSITLGLTTEEIERLNARPRNLSLVSTLDAVSSSSDDNAEKYKLAELLESNTELLEAQDSSTDESGNDSFTCSEFEYDNYDKVHREFGPRNMIFSKLAEEDNENDEDYAKNYDGFDSFRGSFSTLVASDDESSNPPPYKPTNGSMLGWDCLLNWGPNFENLVGVFKDIEQLPDNVNSSGPGHSQTDEDYV